MKKLFASILVLIVLFSLVGCGSKDDAKINGDTTIQIGETVYYNTKEAIPVEPAESAIVYPEPSEGSDSPNDVISAYAFINEDTIDGELLVALIEGEWYKFLPKSVTAITE